MGSDSHASEGERERYERIAATAAELAQLLMALAQGAPTPRDLFVENITALLDDAVALAPREARTSERRQPAVPPPGYEVARELARIDAQTVTTGSSLRSAISDARQACKALAAASGRPDPSLLHTIAAALSRIGTCYQTLGRLSHERTLAVSSPRTSAADRLDPRTSLADTAPSDPRWDGVRTPRYDPSSKSPRRVASPHDDVGGSPRSIGRGMS
jgi:hypothetical protein